MSELTNVKRVELFPGSDITYYKKVLPLFDDTETEGAVLEFTLPQSEDEKSLELPDRKSLQWLTPEGGSVIRVALGPLAQPVVAQLLLEGLPVAKRLEIFAREAKAIRALADEDNQREDAEYFISDILHDLTVCQYDRAIAKAGGNWEGEAHD